MHVDKREQRLQQKFRRWPDVRLRLQHSWGPDKVLGWYRERFPGEPAPSRTTLFRFLADKPPTWFVTPLAALDIVTGQVPRLLVLERQTVMIQVMEARLSRALVKEREFADSKTPLLPEVRENLSLLSRMYNDHFRTLQESGLEPKVTQNVKVEQTGQVYHEVFQFLRPEEALRLKRVEEDIAAGKLDALELYRTAAGIFKVEQAAADGQMLARRDVGL